MPSGQPWQLYAPLSTPVVVLDAEARVMYLNPRAEAFWRVRLEDVAGRAAWEAFRDAPSREAEDWVREVLFPAVDAGTTVTVPVRGVDGGVRTGAISGTWRTEGDERFAVCTVAGEGIGPEVVAPPEWALRDPLTGLHNLHHWQQQFPAWNAREGALAFFDLDGLKEINDLSSHRSGDRALAITGRALAAETPEDALLVRYGGDEFVLVVGSADAAELDGVARRVLGRAAAAAQEAGLLPLDLSFGIASFGPGGLGEAVQQADDAMYEGRGVLMRGARGDRIVLTRAGRNLVRGPGADPEEEQRPGAFAAGFGADFDRYFRQAFARAVAQAREFVDFVSPKAGEAVVEVGAGAGRISFDGGLAGRVGPRGQLLITEPSAAQLYVARKRAQDLGLDWVRFLEAPVEDLPLASGTVGLVLGSTFLHFTEPAVAIRSMARIVRPGGRVAVNAWVDVRFGDGWLWALEPVRQETRRRGLALDPFLPQQGEVEAAFAMAGLQVDATRATDDERADCPNAEIALGVARQIGIVRLLLRRAADDGVRALERIFEDRLRERFGESGLDWSTASRMVAIMGHRPDQSD